MKKKRTVAIARAKTSPEYVAKRPELFREWLLCELATVGFTYLTSIFPNENQWVEEVENTDPNGICCTIARIHAGKVSMWVDINDHTVNIQKEGHPIAIVGPKLQEEFPKDCMISDSYIEVMKRTIYTYLKDCDTMGNMRMQNITS